MYNHFERAWDFEIFVPEKIENINRIHPLKQREVAYIVRKLEKEEEILRIVVFGSSVEFRCTSKSDIDLYVETSNSEYKIILPYDELTSEVDLIRDLEHDTRLFREIERTGILVYEKENDYV